MTSALLILRRDESVTLTHTTLVGETNLAKLGTFLWRDLVISTKPIVTGRTGHRALVPTLQEFMILVDCEAGMSETESSAVRRTMLWSGLPCNETEACCIYQHDRACESPIVVGNSNTEYVHDEERSCKASICNSDDDL